MKKRSVYGGFIYGSDGIFDLDEVLFDVLRSSAGASFFRIKTLRNGSYIGQIIHGNAFYSMEFLQDRISCFGFGSGAPLDHSKLDGEKWHDEKIMEGIRQWLLDSGRSDLMK